MKFGKNKKLHNLRLRNAVILVILMFTGSACSFPNLFAATPTPEAQPTTVIENKTPDMLSPSLVEITPLPGSELSLNNSFRLYFDQPMDRASVEGAIKIVPNLSGRFNWLNDQQVEFFPEQNLPLASEVVFYLDQTAHSTTGLALSKPVEVNYKSAQPLKITQRLPEPALNDVNVLSAISISFNQPVVNLGLNSDSPPAFTIEPTVEGEGKWINTSTYLFTPQPALQGGVEYQVTIDPKIKSTKGTDLIEGELQAWTFRTASPDVVLIQPDGNSLINLDSSFEISFNQPMSTQNVAQNFSFSDQNGLPVAGKFIWEDKNQKLIFKPEKLLNRDTRYRLKLNQGIQSSSGAVVVDGTQIEYQTVPPLKVVSTTPPLNNLLETYSGYGSLEIHFSAPLDPAGVNSDMVNIQPQITNLNISIPEEEKLLFISGFFEPDQKYTLILDEKIADLWGETLGESAVFKFQTMPAAPSLSILSAYYGTDVIFVPADESGLSAKATNITALEPRSKQINLNQFFEYKDTNSHPMSAQLSFMPVQKFELQPNQNQSIEIKLNDQNTPLATGIYAYSFSAPSLSKPTELFLIVSRTILLLKQSQDELFVWAVDLESKNPQAMQELNLYNSKGGLIGSEVTSEEGIVVFHDLPADYFEANYYVVLGKPGDENFSLAMSGWNYGISPWDYDLPTTYGGEDTKVYIYTDKPIYQPGQTVHFRTIIRKIDNSRYFSPDLDQISIVVKADYDLQSNDFPVIDRFTLPLSEYQTANGSFTLPETAVPGNYTIELDGYSRSYSGFEVAEYRKPEIDVALNFSQPESRVGADLTADLTAKYFFGSSASNVPFQWALYARNDWFEIPGGYQTGTTDEIWQGPQYFESSLGSFILQGEGQTGLDGKYEFQFSGDQLVNKLPSGLNPQRLTLEVTIEDESGYPVSFRSEVLLHPEEYYIGIRAEKWGVSAGTEIGFSVQTSDWQKEPSGEKTLVAKFGQVNWISESQPNGFGGNIFTKEFTPIASTTFQTDAKGEARIAFHPLTPGIYQLQISGDQAVTESILWVSGEGAAVWPEPPDQHISLTLDQVQYKVGDTATLFIPNPFDQPVKGLITIERGKVMRSYLVSIEGNSLLFELPVEGIDAPNSYISVLLIGETNAHPDFRLGYQELKVDPENELFQVNVSIEPENASPGDEVRVLLDVKDSTGNPVKGEFSVAMVDKAVFALAKPNSLDIIQAFYGEQPLGTQTSFSLAVYAGRVLNEGGDLGGAGGGAFSSPQTREDFQDTAFWSGDVVTDESGKASIQVLLPDNLTTWQVNVRGIDRQNRVGEASIELISAKDLFIRPVVPKFFVSGDHVNISAVVHNDTAENIEVTVFLEPTGFDLDDPAANQQTFTIGASERVALSWWGTVQNVETVSIIFVASGGGYSDRTTAGSSEIPVLRYSAPQVFATSGILDEPGSVREFICLPKSFIPEGGQLQVELAPTLAASILSGLEAQEAFPTDSIEALLSSLLPNLATYQALQKFGIQSPNLENKLQTSIHLSLNRINALQNQDGGWGWYENRSSDPYLSAYVLFGLSQVKENGVFVDNPILENAANFITASIFSPGMTSDDRQLDQLAFYYYVLLDSNLSKIDPVGLYEFRDRLSPSGKAFLALAINHKWPDDIRVKELLSEMKTNAVRSSTGAHWENRQGDWISLQTPLTTTAMVSYALAKLDPASSVLNDAVRYMVYHRNVNGGWASSYETSWTILSLIEIIKGTGEIQSNFSYAASFNQNPLVNGTASGVDRYVPVQGLVEIDSFKSNQANTLDIEHGPGNGKLYYRATLRLDKPASEAVSSNGGISIERTYYLSDQNCSVDNCESISGIRLSQKAPVYVDLKITIPQDMVYVEVKDFIPAGSEIVNTVLQTSQMGTGQPDLLYELENPYQQGWGWWNFRDPQISDDSIRWVAEYLPAGTYVLRYRLLPLQAGEYQVLPAQAKMIYFPEIQGTSAGTIFSIEK